MYSNIVPNDYNRDIAPAINGRPVEVNVSINVLSVRPDINAKMSFSFDLFYNLNWNDYRLRGPIGEKISLGPHWKDKLWLPGIYFHNMITNTIPKMIHESTYFTITNSTNVFLCSHFQMKLRCDMNFFKFPFDRQICSLNISTLYQTTEEVVLFWSEKDFNFPLQLNLPEYEIVEDEFGETNKTYPKIGTISSLYLTTRLKRNFGKYLIKRYIPSTLIVCMSFVSFWIPTDVITARVTLTITTLLALITQQIQGELNISYIYALEVYTILCIVFVFATLIEFAFAISLYYDQTHQKQYVVPMDSPPKRSWYWPTLSLGKPHDRNCMVDVMARTIFPLSFGISIITYSLFYYFT